MDKSWIRELPYTDAYQTGLNTFLDYAFEKASTNGLIRCPCKKCCNSKWLNRILVHEHLTIVGWGKGYASRIWIHHGEFDIINPLDETSDEQNECQEVDDMHGMLHGAFGVPTSDVGSDELIGEPNPEAAKFYNLINDAEQELYPGCKKFSKLAFLIRLFHIKCLHGLSDKGFTMLLELLKEALPEGETLPKSFYYTKKIIGELGLGYNKIDACPNDCMLYWKNSVNDTQCSVCGASRWKTIDDNENSASLKKRHPPAKVLRHFPLKPRLQRLFMSDKTAGVMRWHANDRTKDGVLRHPADSQAWAQLDNRYPHFAAESRNVRLGSCQLLCSL